MKRASTFIAALAAAIAGTATQANLVEENWHVFSRSCPLGLGAQESITYAFNLKRWIYVVSEHYRIDETGLRHWLHNVTTPTDGPKGAGWHFGRRGRAGDFGEFWYGHVTGHHWGLRRHTGEKYIMWHSDATDCNLKEW